MGHDSVKALSGAQARAVLAQQQPDAVLLDIMLPETNGIDLCREWRGVNRTAGLPIIIISACAPPMTKEALEAGANAYLSKPVDLQVLQATLTDVGIPASRSAR
jgi:DNA-binding response OmpR family regulator